MIPQHGAPATHDLRLQPHPQAHPIRTPTEISEAIRILDESHKQQMTELRMRMDALHQEYSREQERYSRERQELRTKLQQALCSQEVVSDPVNMPLPGLYPQSMMSNMTPMMAPSTGVSMPASMAPTASQQHTSAPPPATGSIMLDSVSTMMDPVGGGGVGPMPGMPGDMVPGYAASVAALPTQQQQPQANPAASAGVTSAVVPTGANPPMTSSGVALTSSLTPLQYAAVLPGSRYQIQVNPDGSHQVIHVQQPPNAGPLTVVTTTPTAMAASSMMSSAPSTTSYPPTNS